MSIQGFCQGLGVSVDFLGGDVYVARDTDVQRLARSGTVLATYHAPLVRCRNVAFDSTRGGVYAGDRGNAALWYFSPAGLAMPVLSRSVLPMGLAFDGLQHDLYATDGLNRSVVKISAAGLIGTPVAIGFKDPRGLAIDAATKTVYVADRAETAIITVLPNGARGRVGSNFIVPEGVARSAQGDIFVADAYGLSRIRPSGAIDKLVNAGQSGAQDVAVDDSDGSVYVVMGGLVSKVRP